MIADALQEAQVLEQQHVAKKKIGRRKWHSPAADLPAILKVLFYKKTVFTYTDKKSQEMIVPWQKSKTTK